MQSKVTGLKMKGGNWQIPLDCEADLSCAWDLPSTLFFIYHFRNEDLKPINNLQIN